MSSRGSDLDHLLSMRGSDLNQLMSSKSELDKLLSSDVDEVVHNETSCIMTIWCWTKSIIRRIPILCFVVGAYAAFGLMMDSIFGELEIDKEIDSFRFIISLILAYMMMFWVFLGAVGTIMGDWRWLYNLRFVIEQVYRLCHLLAERVQE